MQTKSLGFGIVVVGMMVSGCDPNKGTLEPVAEPAEVELFKPVCESGDCEIFVTVPATEIASCYGWNGVAYTITPPAEVLLDCPDPTGLAFCDLSVGTHEDVFSAVDPDCNCVPESVEIGPECCDNLWQDAEELESLAEFLMNEIENACLASASVTAECTGGLVSATMCDDGDGFSVPPNADLILYLDELNSYIEVTTPFDNQTFPVSGGGSANLSPNGFLSATAWADDGELGGYDWTDWKWWMTAPLSIDLVSGAFTVPVSGSTPPFHGGGYQDTTPKRAEVYMAEEPSGHVYPLTDTFDLDFTQTSYGWTIEVHLEGDFEAAP